MEKKTILITVLIIAIAIVQFGCGQKMDSMEMNSGDSMKMEDTTKMDTMMDTDSMQKK